MYRTHPFTTVSYILFNCHNSFLRVIAVYAKPRVTLLERLNVAGVELTCLIDFQVASVCR